MSGGALNQQKSFSTNFQCVKKKGGGALHPLPLMALMPRDICLSHTMQHLYVGS